MFAWIKWRVHVVVNLPACICKKPKKPSRQCATQKHGVALHKIFLLGMVTGNNLQNINSDGKALGGRKTFHTLNLPQKPLRKPQRMLLIKLIW